MQGGRRFAEAMPLWASGVQMRAIRQSVARASIFAAVFALLATTSVPAASEELETPDTPQASSLPFANKPSVFESGREPLTATPDGRYWITAKPRWGFAADSDEDAEEFSEAPTDAAVSLDAPSSLDLARGYRLFALHALYRPIHAREDAHGVAVSPYLGLGAGFAMPYAESQVDTYRAGDQFTWNGMRGLAGVSVRLRPNLSFYGEYSVDRPTLDFALKPADILRLDSPTERVQLGISYDF